MMLHSIDVVLSTQVFYATHVFVLFSYMAFHVDTFSLAAVGFPTGLFYCCIGVFQDLLLLWLRWAFPRALVILLVYWRIRSHECFYAAVGCPTGKAVLLSLSHL